MSHRDDRGSLDWILESLNPPGARSTVKQITNITNITNTRETKNKRKKRDDETNNNAESNGRDAFTVSKDIIVGTIWLFDVI
jgi:hypothetical protein